MKIRIRGCQKSHIRIRIRGGGKSDIRHITNKIFTNSSPTVKNTFGKLMANVPPEVFTISDVTDVTFPTYANADADLHNPK